LAELFISFIHEEEAWASHAHIFITRVLGTIPFFSSDKGTIFAGDDWMQRIMEELKDCKVLVSMLSPQSISRQWINFEAGAAWMRAKVIPVCFGGLKVDNLPKPYSSLQAVDLETYDGSYYLVSSIANHLGLLQPKRPIFPPYSEVAAILAGGNVSNDELLGPYKFLQTSIKISNDIKNGAIKRLSSAENS
jgi:hypothetical protein